jgi:hypothetical protein
VGGMFFEFFGQGPDRFVVPVDVAGLHFLVLAPTKRMGASINAWAA